MDAITRGDGGSVGCGEVGQGKERDTERCFGGKDGEMVVSRVASMKMIKVLTYSTTCHTPYLPIARPCLIIGYTFSKRPSLDPSVGIKSSVGARNQTNSSSEKKTDVIHVSILLLSHPALSAGPPPCCIHCISTQSQVSRKQKVTALSIRQQILILTTGGNPVQCTLYYILLVSHQLNAMQLE